MKTPFELFGFEGIDKSGWWSFVEPVVKKCQEMGVEIVQVKEKFGTLRFYPGAIPNTEEGKELEKAIEEAEKRSEHVCMECGKPGKLWAIWWWQTLCREHAIEHYGKDLVENYEWSKGNFY